MIKNAIRLFFTALFIFLVIQCRREYGRILSTEDADTLVLGDTLSISYKDTLYNQDEAVFITFDSLIADSRCPIGVVCFWEGNAELSFVFNKTRFSLNTHPAFVTDTTLFEYKILLVQVYPYPHIDSTYTADRYRAEICVLK
jgi:hypothetical protein